MPLNPTNSPLRPPGRTYRASKFAVGALSGLAFLGLLGGALALQKALPLSPSARKLQSGELFDLTNIWTVHLKFSAEAWKEMEPTSGPGFGPFGGPGGPGGPGQRPVAGQGFGGGPGPGPGGFGPAMILAPAFLKEAAVQTQSQGKTISRSEFEALGEKWFAAWDTNHTGALDLNKIQTGLNKVILENPFGGPGGPGGRGPGPGPGLQGQEGKRNGLASAMGIEFKWVKADLEFEGLELPNVEVRYKGNGTFMESRSSLKRSLKVRLNKGAHGSALGEVSILNLHNNVADPSWMNEPLSYRLYREAGVPAPRTAYARVFVTVPGQFEKKYFGLYSLVENVDTHFLRNRFVTRRGALFKPVTRQPFEDLGNDWKAYRQTYDPKTRLGEEQIQRVIAFCKLVSHATDAEFEGEIENYVDLDELARFMAVTTFLSTMDSILSLGQNYLVHLHPKTAQFQFIPWDLDHSFGQFPMVGSEEERENLSLDKPWTGELRLLQRIFKTAAFQKLYRARLNEFDRTLFRPERFAEQVDQLAAILRPAIEEESPSKLERFDKVVAGQSVQPGFGGDGDRLMQARDNGQRPGGRQRPGGPGFGGPPGFMQAAKPIKPFVKVRAQSVHDQLAGKSAGLKIDGFGGPGFRGPGAPGRAGGPGGPGGFGPGNFLSQPIMQSLDADKSGTVTREEFHSGFKKWFEAWDTDKKGVISEDQLRAGINKDLSPFRFGPPPGFGPGMGPPPAFGAPPDADQDDPEL